MLPIYISDTVSTSQDGSSLEFVAATAGREFYIQDARCIGQCCTHHLIDSVSLICKTWPSGLGRSNSCNVLIHIYLHVPSAVYLFQGHLLTVHDP